MGQGPIAVDVIKLPGISGARLERLAEEALDSTGWRCCVMCRCGITTVVAWCVTRSRSCERRLNAQVTPADIVSARYARRNRGALVSRFIWMPVPYGAQNRWQQYRVAFRGADFMTRWDEYLKVANGEWPPGIMNHYADLYYLRSGRDVSEYVHWDFATRLR